MKLDDFIVLYCTIIRQSLRSNHAAREKLKESSVECYKKNPIGPEYAANF